MFSPNSKGSDSIAFPSSNRFLKFLLKKERAKLLNLLLKDRLKAVERITYDDKKIISL